MCAVKKRRKYKPKRPYKSRSKVKRKQARSYYSLGFLKVPKRWVWISALVGLSLLTASSIFLYRSYRIKEFVQVVKSPHLFGIDVSHYQGKIYWNELEAALYPINYVFIRATMGSDGVDNQFKRNWHLAGEKNYVRGAYHYYRPYENSNKQFANFSSQVALSAGDFIPILDIEEESPFGSSNLRKGVLNWLRLAEAHYGVKPMIYTGREFYHKHLKGHVEAYPLWIASYSNKQKMEGIHWTFHQFSDRLRIRGISGPVDGDFFRGKRKDLESMCIP